MPKTCEFCGKTFEGHHLQKYCSPECAKDAKRQYQRLFRQVYKDELKRKKNFSNWMYRAATCDLDGLWKAFCDGKLTYDELCKVEAKRICSGIGYLGGC